jgi:cytochrome c-type biogenesis protein CcmF
MGSYWAYYELGWGGWWFWDPVENASFMPWLVGTALLHSAIVMEKREALKVWTCCWPSSPSRSRCSAPSWCAPAC